MTGLPWHNVKNNAFLYLPEGTIVRCKHRLVWETGEVRDGAIWWRDKPHSPASFANAVRCSTTNAWATLWLTFPGETEQVRADRCQGRTIAQAAEGMAARPEDLAGSCDPVEFARACGRPELANWFAYAMENARRAGT